MPNPRMPHPESTRGWWPVNCWRPGVVRRRRSFLHRDGVVFPFAVDELDERVDAGARRLARDDERELHFGLVDVLAFEGERGALGVEHADVDPFVERALLLEAARVGFHLLAAHLHVHVVFAVAAPGRGRRQRVVLEEYDLLEQVADERA